MRKKGLIDEVNRRVAGTSGDPITRRDVEQVVDALIDTVADTLHKGDQIQLVGFGTFKTGTINPTNPQTREKMGPRQVPRFTAGKKLKDAVHSQEPASPAGW
jgi:nucleoid DNA-binding protein